MLNFPPHTQAEFINDFFTLVACAYFQVCEPGDDAQKQSCILSEGGCAGKIAGLEIPQDTSLAAEGLYGGKHMTQVEEVSYASD